MAVRAVPGVGRMAARPGVFTQLMETFRDDPLTGVAFAAGVVALATTPIAFAVLGRLDYFETRRGRTLQKPTFSSVVAALMLVMGIPAIYCAIVAKSRHFDEDRYAFDPNRTPSVLDQGRGFRSVEEADEAVRKEMARLAEERKNLVNTVKKLDEAMLTLRAAALHSPEAAKALPPVLERLAGVRASVGVDAPQQLINATAPPAALANVPPAAASPTGSAYSPMPATTAANPAVPAVQAIPAAGGGLSGAEADAEIATVPEPQRKIAAMLPLTDLPAGWELSKSGDKHLETFNADNLFEKIDGRAESFVQYDVKGMAYASFHPAGDDSSDIQVYIFEMGGALKALGKYGSEKPDGVKPLPIGSEGYSTAGSTLFYAGPYYTQIVSTKDDAKFAAFARELAGRIAGKQAPRPAAVAAATAPGTTPAPPPAAGPEAVFALLPAGPKKTGPKFVPQDVFGYSFLADVFMADYEEGDVKWQGFLRPYATPDEARAVFDKYLDGAKQDGAEVREVKVEGVDRMVVSSNIGLFDAIFQKGNAVGGANGATRAEAAEKFAAGFAKALPAAVPAVGIDKKD